ncbi:hypothetical protein [uncultured Shewanella sp.]|uniref:hypothetical protein n=1 Tax=uncultured Shewanella sp. TaxID=173975 RepID=UPI0026033801|nr:hypothetical protein [uncultured Shewanella sp.]
MPKKLDDLVMLLRVDGIYTPTNPLADTVHQYKFHSDNNTFMVTILNTKEVFSGVYEYEYFDPQLTRINFTYGKAQTLTIYSISLVCETQRVGYFIFSQSQGAIKPNVRQNTGVYVIE